MQITAAVTREKAQPFIIEEVDIEEPRPDEVLVKIVATGICHTDLIVRDQWLPVPLPIVLGHEGAGVVERVGQSVTKVQAIRHRLRSGMASRNRRGCWRCAPKSSASWCCYSR